MSVLDENTGEFEACLKVKLGDRLRALQENANKWQQPRRASEDLPKNVNNTLEERRKVFANANAENKAPSFAIQKATRRTTLTNIYQQIKPFETIKVKRPAFLEQQQQVDDKSITPKAKTIHHFINEEKPQLPATNDASNNDALSSMGVPTQNVHVELTTESPQVLKSREENQPAEMSSEKAEDGEKAERPSHFLPTTKRTVARPGRRVPTRFQNAANKSEMPTVSLNSELHLDTEEDKENKNQQPVTLRKTNLRVSSAVPFQLPVIGKEHCGVQLRNVDRSSSFPDPLLVRALCVGKSVDLRLIQPNKNSVTEHGSYLLVTSKKMIMRHGKEATVQERSKIAQLSHEVIAGKEMFAYSGKPELANEDGLAEAGFWRHLSEDQNEVVEDFQQFYQKSFAFYRIDESGEANQLECENVSTFALDSNQIYVIDFGSELYTWLGKNCNRSLAKHASEFVDKLKSTPFSVEMRHFICASEEDQKRPSWILCRRLSEGISDSLFRHKFEINTAPPKPSGIHLKSTQSQTQVGKLSTNFSANLRNKPTAFTTKTHQLKDENVLATELAFKFAQSTLTKDYFIELDDTQIHPFDPNVFTEQLNCFVLNGESLEKLDEQPSEFDCRKCYVIEWRYRVERPGVRKLLNNEEAKKHDTGRERGVYFYWLGQNSTVKEQSFCALALRNMDKERLEHIRIEQNHEHPLFISLFNDNSLIVSGTETQFFLFHSYGPDGNLLAMSEMHGYTGRSQTAMAQIKDDRLICQRGNDCPQNVWSNSQNLAKKFAEIRQLKLECLETTDFECLKPLSWKQSPRFYRIYELEGDELFQNRSYFTFPACQSDLSEDGCILVENDDFLWLWSNEVPSTFALKVANHFCTERKIDAESNAKVICSGNEPSEFMALFCEWKSPENDSTAIVQSLAQLLRERTATRSLQDIREKKLPEGCDLKRLELYLSDTDFESVFKMSKDDFSNLASWKQIRLKKEAGLF